MDPGVDTERALVEMSLLNNKMGHMKWVMMDLGEDTERALVEIPFSTKLNE